MNNFRGGFGGNNIQNLMRQAQKMQQDMQEKQEKLAETEVIGTVSGGLVSVVMMGDKSVKKVTIKPEIVDKEDVEMLEDLVLAAIRDANEKVDSLKEEIVGDLPLGM